MKRAFARKTNAMIHGSKANGARSTALWMRWKAAGWIICPARWRWGKYPLLARWDILIFAIQRGDGSSRVTVLETKGDQLDNLDTDYKRRVLGLMAENFAWDNSLPAGQLALVKDTGETVSCELILMSEIPTKLPTYLAAD